MSLAGLLSQQDRGKEAHAILAETYARFNEGFGAADVKAAKLLWMSSAVRAETTLGRSRSSSGARTGKSGPHSPRAMNQLSMKARRSGLICSGWLAEHAVGRPL